MSTSEERIQVDNEIAASLRELSRQVGIAVENGRHSCVNCFHFNGHREVCELYSQRPPARVIAFGCPSYEGPIPF